MNRKIHLKSILLGVGLTAGVGFAATQVSSLVPHVFSAGTPIKASEINANFAAVGRVFRMRKPTASQPRVVRRARTSRRTAPAPVGRSHRARTSNFRS